MPENIQTQKEIETFDKEFFSWDIPEFTLQKRSVFWYLAMIILAIGLIIYSIITANFLFALIIIIAVFILFLKNYSLPKNVNFKIARKGIAVGNQFFSYDKIRNFYIIYEPPVIKKLYFVPKGFSPAISIPLFDKNPIEIRKKLLEYLEEDFKKEHQSFDDQIETILKL